MELSLTKLPWYAQVGAFVALALGGIGAFYYYYEMPFRADMVSREGQLKALQGDISKGLATAKQLPEFRAEVTDLESGWRISRPSCPRRRTRPTCCAACRRSRPSRA